jgi:hypothetical protein
MPYPVSHLNYCEKIGPTEYRGMRSYEVPCGQWQAEIDSLWFQPFPGMTGDAVPICKRPRAILVPEGMVGKACIVAEFESLRTPGRAKLETTTASRKTIPMLEDLDGKTIQGPDNGKSELGAAAQGQVIWRVVQGDPYYHVMETPFKISTAFWANQFSLARVYALCPAGRPRVNKSSLSVVGFGTTIAAESLMCLGVNHQQIYGYDMCDVDFLLAWSGPDRTWNQLTQSQPGAWIAMQAKVHDEEWHDTGRNRVKMMFAPLKDKDGSDIAPQSRRAYPTSDDFTLLQGLQLW